MKKRIAFLVFCAYLACDSVAQLQVPAVRIFLEDVEGRPLKLKGIDEVEGTPFLFEDWKQGSVTFNQGSVLSGVDLKFAVFGNQLFFRKGDDMLEFTMPVKEFRINASVTVPLVYRCYYPDISGNNGKTFYNVVVDGNIQLLKLVSREVKDHKSYNEPVKKKFMDKETWYVFLPNGTIHILERDTNWLKKLLPQHADKIDNIIAEKKLKLKKDEDVAELIRRLNV